jgi:hypothetical protein
MKKNGYQIARRQRDIERGRLDRKNMKRRNRRRVERAERGACGKRRWLDLEQAKSGVMRSLLNPRCRFESLAIYVCPECGAYHQTSQLNGGRVVVILSREPE